MAEHFATDWSKNPGTYALVMELSGAACLHIGRLGHIRFDGGWYVYAGSALGPGGLKGRLARHNRKDKRLRWHIDYLLDRATLREVWYVEAEARLECGWAGVLASLPDVRIPAHGFGSSDCRCPSHLLHTENCPSFPLFVCAAAALSAAEVQQVVLIPD